MSIFRYIFDNGFIQRSDIEELRATQSRQSSWRSQQNRQTTARLTNVEGEVGELALFCRTAVTLLIEKGVITEKEFLRRMKEIDQTDGRADGKLTKRKGK